MHATWIRAITKELACSVTCSFYCGGGVPAPAAAKSSTFDVAGGKLGSGLSDAAAAAAWPAGGVRRGLSLLEKGCGVASSAAA